MSVVVMGRLLRGEHRRHGGFWWGDGRRKGRGEGERGGDGEASDRRERQVTWGILVG